VALPGRNFGAHLDDAARSALEKSRAYPPVSAVLNPLTRPLVRRLAENDWRGALAQIDFPYEITPTQIAGVGCARYTTPATSPDGPVILYLHAGAFFAGSPEINAAGVLPACHLAGAEGVAIRYPLAPDAVYPAQLQQIDRVYRSLVAGGVSAARIVLVGDSAGGNLAAASILRWRRAGLAAPAGLVLISAPLDATASSDSYKLLQSRDPLFHGDPESGCKSLFRLYAGAADARDPEISPLFADLSGFPPTLVQVGTREIFLGDAARFAEKARAAGVEITLRVFDGMFHLFHQHWRLKEARAAQGDVAAFVRRIAAERP
jgi:acetyl esterase/lipase